MESSDKNVADSSDKLVNNKNKWQLFKLLGRTKKRKNTNYSQSYEDFSTNSSLSSEKPPDRISTQSGFIKRPQLLGQTFIKPRYKSDSISDLSDGSNGKHAKIPESINTQCWNIGWTDGRLGQDPQTGLSAADSQATIDWYNSLDSAYFDIAKDEATMQGYLVLKERATEKLKKINDYLGRVEFDGKHPSVSGWLGVFYILVAVLLVFADVPVTFNSISNVFELDEPDVFLNRLIWPLSIAVGFSSTFIKYYLDEVLSSKNSKWYLYIILVLLSLTLLSLGLTRNFANSEFNGSEDGTNYFEWFKISTFVLLTFILPVIGGVVFYAGMKEVRFCRLVIQRNGFEKDLDQLNKKYEKCRHSIAAKRKILEREEIQKDARNSIAILYKSIYEHGYARGQSIPETLYETESLYERCERVVMRALSKK